MTVSVVYFFFLIALTIQKIIRYDGDPNVIPNNWIVTLTNPTFERNVLRKNGLCKGKDGCKQFQRFGKGQLSSVTCEDYAKRVKTTTTDDDDSDSDGDDLEIADTLKTHYSWLSTRLSAVNRRLGREKSLKIDPNVDEKDFELMEKNGLFEFNTIHDVYTIGKFTGYHVIIESEEILKEVQARDDVLWIEADRRVQLISSNVVKKMVTVTAISVGTVSVKPSTKVVKKENNVQKRRMRRIVTKIAKNKSKLAKEEDILSSKIIKAVNVPQKAENIKQNGGNRRVVLERRVQRPKPERKLPTTTSTTISTSTSSVISMVTQSGADWGLVKISESSKGNYIYPTNGQGEGTTVYVIDTGIDVNNVDFQGRASWGANFVDTKYSDENGHGTSCSRNNSRKDFWSF